MSTKALHEWRKRNKHLYPLEHGKASPTFEVPMTKNPQKLGRSRHAFNYKSPKKVV